MKEVLLIPTLRFKLKFYFCSIKEEAQAREYWLKREGSVP
jgi:hypothetical protein